MAREETDSDRSSSLCTFRIRGILYVVRWVGQGGSWGQRTDSGPFPAAASTQGRSEDREEKRDEEMSFFGGRERLGPLGNTYRRGRDDVHSMQI